jgi:Cu(I)/Ag(I) efflux system membrane protein CusA/SilA
MEMPDKNMFFDISSPSDQIVRTLRDPGRPLLHSAIEELGIVSLVLVLFFSRIPAVFVPLTAIPIVIIVAIVPVLGAIAVAIALIIEATVLVFGPSQKKTDSRDEEERSNETREKLISAVKRINRPSFFAVLVIAISFLPMFAPQDKLDARVVEITRQEPTKVVWELYISGQESYRTVHLPSLYPEVQW